MTFTVNVKFVFELSLLLFATHNSIGEERSDPIIFDFRFEHRLDLPSSARKQSNQVIDMMGCLGSCVNAHWCKSGNLKTTPESNGLYVCEALSSDESDKNNKLIKEKEYQYFRIKVSF